MMRLTARLVPLAVAAALLSPLALTGTASAAPAHYPCGGTPPDLDPAQGTNKANGANMRTGSSTSCPSRGLAYLSNTINYHCYTLGQDGYSWTYARNLSTGYAGWIRDDLLRDGGSRIHCPS
ncbi:SH3 domain-containing protein [Streptomyces sp. NPDC049916]|uniref:SH3 domain-containing protein n=1 Tax=Streptomyces sp. NPDC049916 TaxID=3155156 RepID=UPI00342A4192